MAFNFRYDSISNNLLNNLCDGVFQCDWPVAARQRVILLFILAQDDCGGFLEARRHLPISEDPRDGLSHSWCNLFFQLLQRFVWDSIWPWGLPMV